MHGVDADWQRLHPPSARQHRERQLSAVIPRGLGVLGDRALVASHSNPDRDGCFSSARREGGSATLTPATASRTPPAATDAWSRTRPGVPCCIPVAYRGAHPNPTRHCCTALAALR